MSDGLSRILQEISSFSEAIDRYHSAIPYNGALCRDAYNALNRIRDRYLHERDENRSLELAEDKALRKVFEEDRFIKGMLLGRQIGEHVQIDEPVIRLYTNSPIPLCAETSAGSFFGGSIASVRDVKGKTHYIDHMKQLKEAQKRIQQALGVRKR
jgi:hypothetical protein